MPARDIYHAHVKNALIKDGWTITHDPYPLHWGGRDTYIDLGAERIIAAEKSGEKIAVEIKSFVGESELKDLQQAIGQYILYYYLLDEEGEDRVLYLAVRRKVYKNLFQEPVGQLMLDKVKIRLIVFDPEQEVIDAWIP
jgi:hypothetical protein